MNEDFVENIMADVNAAAERAIRPAVADVYEGVREAVSVPVGYAQGPRGGVMVVRSLPGEAPRKERGVYRDSWQQEVAVDGDRVEGTVFTDDIRGLWFAEGTKVGGVTRMAPRPHGEQQFNEVAPSLPARVAENL
ncbi:MAG TPA: hypothetical protein VGN72_01110 [Tepidisphaeraceae bacterium]|jgi:hypothetical protein|nr:hypothetical protein [Tepidisphaeraceae bacterium]